MRTIAFLLLAATAMSGADAPRRAPGFALIDSKMKLHDLYDYRGKPVIVEFMQTTCPHCGAFVSVLQKLQQKFGDRVAILAIADPPDNPQTIGGFVTEHKVTYPVLLDMGQVAYSYVMKTPFDLPQVFVVDANGMIQRHYEYGPLTRDIFEGNGLVNDLDRILTMKK